MDVLARLLLVEAPELERERMAFFC